MSATDSNLQSVGYDLVLGVTQDAINANLKRYLDNSLDPFPPAYYFYVNGGYDLYTETDALTRTNGINPFNLPSIEFGYNDQGQLVVYDGPAADTGTRPSHLPTAQESETIQQVEQLYFSGFSFAFWATVGFDRNSPDVLILDTKDQGNNQQVLYQLFFETFQIVGLQEVHGDYTFTNEAQPEDNPWIYSWTVDLNITTSNTAFEDLPPETQAALQNLDNGSMFSIQQLALDLTQAPQYNGLISDTGAPIEGYPDLNSYLNSFWDYLKDTEATTLLNAALPTAPSNNPSPSLVPTALNFVVKSYDGTPENAGLDTLNYLVMSNNNPLPDPVHPLTWNWVEQDDTGDTDLPSGVMSTQKADFVSYIKPIFEENLSSICVEPAIDVDFEFGDSPFNYSETFYQNPTYTIIDAGEHVLGFEYTSPVSEDSDLLYSSKTYSYIKSDIYFEKDTIKCVTIGEVYVDLDLKALVPISKTRGDVVAQKNTAVFTMSANPDGSLNIDLETTIEDLLQYDDEDAPYYGAEPSTFASFFGNMDSFLNSITNQADNLKTWMNNYDASIKDLLNDTSAWVFPGADTFSMLNPYFSDQQDLTIEVSYTTTD